jgi:curved DNA-binding protein CbpA
MKQYYELLGLTEEATDEEIKARYDELKAKYKEDRWLDGEAGNEAARMLTKLDVAYAEITAARKEQSKNTEGQDSFEAVSALIKENKLAEAQTALDEFNERSAEWHYLQAVVYYKKNWTNDSKKQLEIAMQMDPENRKYREAYGKLNAKNEYQQQQAHQQQQQQQRPYQGPYSSDYNEEHMGGCPICLPCCCCPCMSCGHF